MNGNSNPTAFWKSVALALLTICMFLVGGAFGDWSTMSRLKEVDTKVTLHAASDAHPVTKARLDAIEKQLDKIDAKLDRLIDQVE